MSWERAQVMASRQLASVGSETTAVMSRRSESGRSCVIVAQTFVVHFEWEVGLRLQRGKRLRTRFNVWRNEGF